MLNELTFALPDGFDEAVRDELAAWRETGRVKEIWARQSGVWTSDGEDKWLGWLGIIEKELGDLAKYADFAAQAANFRDIVLMGMGGSSLCPEVFSKVFQKSRFHVLDSTVPAQVIALEQSIDPEKTLFIIASKSGSTLEPNTFMEYFFGRVSGRTGAEAAGSCFAAITDPGSKLEAVAKRRGFSRIFLGEPAIGGRFSALSVFGLAPAAAMGLDVESLLSNAHAMAGECREQDPRANPGVLLGAILGVGNRLGRDKLCIIASPLISSVGAWLEQLVAESTGKQGKAIIPFDRGGSSSSVYGGDDRVFVYLRNENDEDPARDEQFAGLIGEGQPVITIDLSDRMNIGQEFFRWEFATAVAGSIMGINPFNQPDVETAKVRAREITDEYEQTGGLPAEVPFLEDHGIRLFTDDRNLTALRSAVSDESVGSYLRAHLSRIRPGDYFAILAYVEMSRDNTIALETLRQRVLEEFRVPVSLQFGPRFQHSTGQAFKGGPDTGVFLQITCDDSSDLRVPGRKYSFGIIKAAQAEGDLRVLLEKGRRALRVHLGSDVPGDLTRLLALFDR